MSALNEFFQNADWKKEKHVPVIESPESVEKGKDFQVARLEFNAHGESAQGPNLGGVYAQSEAAAVFRTDKPGMLMASSYCNIHGLWQSSQRLGVK